jgi:hypothetical protein
VRLRGTTITVTVTRPQMIGAVKVMTMRSRKAPKVVDRGAHREPGGRSAADTG